MSGDRNHGEQKTKVGRTDSAQHIEIPYIVVEANDYFHQLKQFSSHLISYCTIYNDICNKLLKRTLRNEELVRCQPDIVGSLQNDLTAMNVMFGMMKMFCEQIVQVSTPDPSCLQTLRIYFSQTVDFTREAWKKILTCKELRLVLAKEFHNKGIIEVLQRMVAYIRGEEIPTNGNSLITNEWHDLSISNNLGSTNGREGPRNNMLPNLFTSEELETARRHDKDNSAWSKLITSGIGILKCIAAIGGAVLLGSAAGMVLGAVTGVVGGPLGMAVGIGVGMKLGATVGAGLGAVHKIATMDK